MVNNETQRSLRVLGFIYETPTDERNRSVREWLEGLQAPQAPGTGNLTIAHLRVLETLLKTQRLKRGNIRKHDTEGTHFLDILNANGQLVARALLQFLAQ
ncbi:MAG TPA: hypothetical protein DCX25_00085 [Candidatus Pacebacteria bacterium]|nr:MAG: hypothetical protein UX00_C0003G0003 [Microgenomates group bacterium GW2011_GWB1_45_17]KKU24191.1 MAG: hypothetical protein UX36_C0002G0174 [Microgenomates group bacterium GW2011_GWC1_46_15]KKU24906.1 MAG: hypothetical protein UX35_C0001G0088 [Microgenomates group bacterium GW2011_GWA1_46_15]HAV14719.1 hypothetical protein [Candidatus Paceibacterota bacterium]HCR11426.1 hypothetical protein [Candidatus Paceibacterota bacterium]